MKNKNVGNDFGNGDLDLFRYSGSELCEMYSMNYNTIKRRINRDFHCRYEPERFYSCDRIGFVLDEKDFRYPQNRKSKCKYFSNRFAKVLIKERHKELRDEFCPAVIKGNLTNSLHDLHYVINDYKRYYGNPTDEKYFKKKINKYLNRIEDSFNVMFEFYRESLGFVEEYRKDSKYDENELNDFLVVNELLKKSKKKEKDKK